MDQLGFWDFVRLIEAGDHPGQNVWILLPGGALTGRVVSEEKYTDFIDNLAKETISPMKYKIAEIESDLGAEHLIESLSQTEPDMLDGEKIYLATHLIHVTVISGSFAMQTPYGATVNAYDVSAWGFYSSKHPFLGWTSSTSSGQPK